MPEVNSRLPVLQRSLTVRNDSLNEEARTVELIFATQDPQPMWHWDIGDYGEVLVCDESAGDLSRIRSGGALLSEHDRSRQIGVIEEAAFANGQGIAKARFDTHPLAQQEWESVKNKVRRNFSVGYRVKELTAETVSEKDGNVYRATSWEPLEISLVSVPADTNCQAIRSAKEGNQPTQPVAIRIPSTLQISATMKRSLPQFFHVDNGLPSGAAGGGTPNPADAQRQVEADRQKMREEVKAEAIREAKRQRKEHERAIAEQVEAFKETNLPAPENLIRDALENETPVEQFRTAVLDHYRAKNKSARPTASGNGGSGIEVVHEMPRNLRSIGQQICGTDDYKRAIGTSKRAMEVKIADAVNFRATLLTTTTTGFTPTLQPNAPVTIGVQQPTVADLMPQMVTNLGSYPYWQEDSLTLAATSVAEEGLKPEASWDLSQQTAPIVKIAVLGRVSDEAFDDMPSMEGYVNSRLRYMVEMEEDDQLLNGAGGSDMTGIIATTGVQTQALGGLSKPDAVRKAITKVQSIGFYAPDGIVFHPNDWEEICLLKDTAGQYLAGGPFYGPYGNGDYVAFQRFWGLRVVVTTQCPEGTAVVGAWQVGATVLRRKGLTVDTTNSDGDDFKYNRIAIRAEERAGLVVWRPKAFCLVTGI